MLNRYGVDVDYFRRELRMLSLSLDDRPPDELYRYLMRLAKTAAPKELTDSFYLLDEADTIFSVINPDCNWRKQYREFLLNMSIPKKEPLTLESIILQCAKELSNNPEYSKTELTDRDLFIIERLRDIIYSEGEPAGSAGSGKAGTQECIGSGGNGGPSNIKVGGGGAAYPSFKEAADSLEVGKHSHTDHARGFDAGATAMYRFLANKIEEQLKEKITCKHCGKTKEFHQELTDACPEYDRFDFNNKFTPDDSPPSPKKPRSIIREPYQVNFFVPLLPVLERYRYEANVGMVASETGQYVKLDKEYINGKMMLENAKEPSYG